jgi:glycosyltransferase involved in cell wall biosynthesis
MLSIIIPAYNEAENIQSTITELGSSLAGNGLISAHEILVIDDHSNDGTREAVLSMGLENVHCVRLSRRSGSHAALRAGMTQARGDVALLIAADGQDRPDTIQEMLLKWKNGCHVIWALRQFRVESARDKPFSQVFFKLLRSMLYPGDQTIDYSRTGFFMLDRKVLDALNQCPERNTSLGGLMAWVGFNQDTVEYEPRVRRAGKSKWSFRSRIRVAKDWIIAFSGLPLKLMTLAGFLIATVGFLFAGLVIYNALQGHAVQGWSSLVVIVLVLGGFQVLLMGVMGEYMWRNLEESRQRPLYFIESNSLTTTVNSTKSAIDLQPTLVYGEKQITYSG